MKVALWGKFILKDEAMIDPPITHLAVSLGGTCAGRWGFTFHKAQLFSLPCAILTNALTLIASKQPASSSEINFTGVWGCETSRLPSQKGPAL